jgi:hypothetical protein
MIYYAGAGFPRPLTGWGEETSPLQKMNYCHENTENIENTMRI